LRRSFGNPSIKMELTSEMVLKTAHVAELAEVVNFNSWCVPAPPQPGQTLFM